MGGKMEWDLDVALTFEKKKQKEERVGEEP